MRALVPQFMDRMAFPRWRAVGASWDLGLKERRLRRAETAALEKAGRSFRGVPVAPEATGPVAEALARVVALEEHGLELARRLSASLEADRRDYRATDADLGRWLIIVRGILDRLIVRDEAWRARRGLPACYSELGARVMADPAAAEALPAEERASAAAAQKALRDARSEREALLAPYGGQVLPNPLRAVAGEAATFFDFLRDELAKRVVLRLPALTAMVAAWWITLHFTSGRFEGHLNLYSGMGRTELPQATIDWLSFWLPLLAAALVAYLDFTLRRRLRRRYLGEDAAR